MITVAIVTVSDSSSAGTRADASGPALASRVEELGWSVTERRLIPDSTEELGKTMSDLWDKVDVAITTGGTGLGPRDITADFFFAAPYRAIPGFGELMRLEGRKKTKFADLSRGGAVAYRETLVLVLPGSPKGAIESLDAVAHLVPHAVDLLHGRTEHKPKPGA